MRPLFAVLVMAGFAFSGSSFAQENSSELEAVSYTHLTLPTIYSV